MWTVEISLPPDLHKDVIIHPFSLLAPLDPMIYIIHTIPPFRS